MLNLVIQMYTLAGDEQAPPLTVLPAHAPFSFIAEKAVWVNICPVP